MAEIDTSAEAVRVALDGVRPGPWRKDGASIGRLPADESYVAVCVSSGTRTRSEADRNAQFIAWSRDAVPALAAERDQLTTQLAKAEKDCAMFADANARQAMCISFTAANLGPEYCATIEGLPKAARHISAERDRLAAQLTEARAAWEAFKGATVSDDHFAAVDRLDAALGKS